MGEIESGGQDHKLGNGSGCSRSHCLEDFPGYIGVPALHTPLLSLKAAV